MSFEWDDEIVNKFLEEYCQHECLWNPYHRNFIDCYARNEALRKIVRSLRSDLTVEDCLKILRCIRKKYLEEQTKKLTRCSKPRLKWLCIVESMLEKIVRDEEGDDVRKKSRKQLKPKVKTLYRHTISSSNRRKDWAASLVKSKSTSIQRGKSFSRSKGRKKCKKNCQDKLDKESRFCSDVEKTQERNSYCSRPQTAWGRQRENYLDNLKWTTYDASCARTAECPAYSSHLDRISRIENICREPCSLPATTYQCPARSNPPTVSCNWEGRKRNNDIQPTPPSVIEARNCRVTRPTSSCSERRTSSSQDTSCPAAPEKRSRSCKDKDKPTMKTASTSCCPCPEKTTAEKPKQCETTIKTNTELAQMPDACTKGTCPSFSKSTTTTCSEKRFTSNIVPLESNNKCVGTFDCSKNVRFECNQDLQQCGTGFQTTPRVAAKFENGVLEAYSQFKVIFPTRPDTNMNSSNSASTCRENSNASLKAPVKKMTQRVQTDSTTRDCAVSVNSSEFLCPGRPQSAKSSCCPNRCLSQKNMQIGTDDNIVVCYQDNAPESLEAEKTLHDFVLLTPEGKYIPLVRSDGNEKLQMFNECCAADGNRLVERVQDVCETAPSRNREKQMQNPLDDEKCDPSTTKLLLRCLEQMLNLEEQDGKGKSGDTQDPCEPCKRKELVEKAALGCSKEKPSNPKIDLGCPSPRGKLTQNFLEILKCALELDHGKKVDLCDDDGQKQDKNCDCDDVIPQKTEPPTPENSCDIKNTNYEAQGDRLIRCQSHQAAEGLVNKSEVKAPIKQDKSALCQEFVNSTQPINVKESPCRDVPIVRRCAVDSNPAELSRLQPRTTSPNSSSGEKQVFYKKTLKQSSGGHSQILEKTVAYKEASTSGTCIGSPVTKDAGVQENILSTSRGTQCESRRIESKISKANSVGTQKRDTVLEYLVKCANRPEKISPIRPSPRTSKSPTPNRMVMEKSRTNLPADQCQQDKSTRVSYVKCDQFYRSYVVRSPTRLTGTAQENEDGKLKEYHRRVCALNKIYDSGH